MAIVQPLAIFSMSRSGHMFEVWSHVYACMLRHKSESKTESMETIEIEGIVEENEVKERKNRDKKKISSPNCR